MSEIPPEVAEKIKESIGTDNESVEKCIVEIRGNFLTAKNDDEKPRTYPSICIWCNKHFESEDMFNDYCCVDHAFKYHRWQKPLEFFRNIKRYLIWKPYYTIDDWVYSEFCPYCFEKENKHIFMRTVLSGHLYMCENCYHDFEVAETYEQRRYPHVMWKVGRIYHYVKAGGYSKYVSQPIEEPDVTFSQEDLKQELERAYKEMNE